MATVISACYGGYDDVKRPADQTVDCEFLMVTDEPGGNLERRGWRNLHFDDTRHPRTAAKEPKLRPWRFVGGTGPWIWIDASFRVESPTFVADVLAATEGHPIGQWDHPDRDCVLPEAELSATLTKYQGVPVIAQAHHYLDVGHPPRWGLWAAGLIVYRERLDYLADLWSAEINQWGYQDQISQPVALRRAGLRPVSLPHGLRDNPWLTLHPHRSHL